MARRHDHPAWTPGDDAQLAELLMAGKSHAEAAALMGRSTNAVGIRASRIGVKAQGASKRVWDDDEQRDASLFDWPTFRARHPDRTFAAYANARQRFRDRFRTTAKLTDYDKAVRQVTGDAVIAACVHVPQTDPAIWARVLHVGLRHAIPTLILAGDIVTGDMFSKWETGEPYEFDEELESLRLHLRGALAVYDRVVITPGNHISNRIVRVSGGHIRLRHIIDMAGLSADERERVDTTDIDYVELTSGTQRFLVGHASHYSKIDGRVPVTYAEIMESHVIVGNGHRMGFGVSRSGRWHGYEVGTCANPAFMGYARDKLTAYPRMMQGFAMVKNGAVRLFGADVPFTDWAAEL